MSTSQRIAAVEDVPDDTTCLFTVRNGDDELREAVLVRLADGIVGWFNYCQHYTHINLDKGSGAPMRNGELVCANHGAYFEADTGYCNYGPCEGAYLNEIDVAVEDGAVYLTDDDLDFVETGGVDTDPADLSSKSNQEF